jgi:hypothetical protein
MARPQDFTMKIDLGNDAFQADPSEVARILRATADRIDAGTLGTGLYENVYDVNGNNVGTVRLRR